MKRITLLIFTLFLIPGKNYAQTEVSVVHYQDSLLKPKKILVLSMNKIFENRKTVENEISWWLNSRGFNAFPANKLSSTEDFPSTAMIHKMVEDNGFDGVLISNIIDIQMKERYENTQQHYNYNPTVPTYTNFLDAYKNEFNMGYNYNTKTYMIDTKIFDVKTETLLLETNSSTQESNDLDKTIENYSKSLARIIAKKKVLEKKKN